LVRIEGGAAASDPQGMTLTARIPETPTPSAMPPPNRGVTLTRAEFAELMDEVDRLCAVHRADLAERLRDARSFGSPGDDDDWLSVMEDAAVERGRIAQLARLMSIASVVDDAPSGDARAGLGSVVQVRDDHGRTRDYALVGRLAFDAGGSQVSLGSPVGRALAGARAGDVVHVRLPSGHQRALHVVDVRGGRSTEPAAA
jgi:transcription elongation factor GreA